MGTIKGEIPKELESEFRKIIAVKYGLKKGNISIALQNSITDWIAKQKRILNSEDKQTIAMQKQVRGKYPDKFVALDNTGNVLAYAFDIISLYEKVDLLKDVKIIVPDGSRLAKNSRKRQLGWNLKRKTMVK